MGIRLKTARLALSDEKIERNKVSDIIKPELYIPDLIEKVTTI